MAAQRSAPLRSGKQAKRRYVYNWYEVLVSIFYKHNVVGNNTYYMYTKMGGRTHSAVPLQMSLRIYTIVIFIDDIFGSIFYEHIVVVCCYNNESQIWRYDTYKAKICL